MKRNPTRHEPPANLADPIDHPGQRWTRSNVPTAATQGIEQVGTEPSVHRLLRQSVATDASKKGSPK
jgi:hypothetical protein